MSFFSSASRSPSPPLVVPRNRVPYSLSLSLSLFSLDQQQQRRSEASVATAPDLLPVFPSPSRRESDCWSSGVEGCTTSCGLEAVNIFFHCRGTVSCCGCVGDGNSREEDEGTRFWVCPSKGKQDVLEIWRESKLGQRPQPFGCFVANNKSVMGQGWKWLGNMAAHCWS